MNARTQKTGKAYLDLAIDQDLVKELRHLLVDTFNSTRPLSAVIELFIREGMARMTPQEIAAAIEPELQERYTSIAKSMQAGRAKARAGDGPMR